MRFEMDVDGFLLLLDKDMEKFNEWQKKSKKLSLEQSWKDYAFWHRHLQDAKKKYWNFDENEKVSDISEFMGKMAYFLYLENFCWNTLSDYTEKLQKEYNSLKKQKRKTSKTRKRKT